MAHLILGAVGLPETGVTPSAFIVLSAGSSTATCTVSMWRFLSASVHRLISASIRLSAAGLYLLSRLDLIVTLSLTARCCGAAEGLVAIYASSFWVTAKGCY